MTRRLSQSLHTPNLCERSRLIEMRFRRLAMKQPTPRRCPNGASCGSTFRSRLCATTTSSSLRRVVRFIARAKPEIIWDHHSGRLLPLQVAIPYFLSMHYRGVLPPEWRFLPLFISLDIAHNVTTAFFLQTLKFHKFISATTFSFAFNTTAYIGSAMLLYYYLTQPVDPIAFFPAVAGCLMNLYFVFTRHLHDGELTQTSKTTRTAVARRVVAWRAAARASARASLLDLTTGRPREPGC